MNLQDAENHRELVLCHHIVIEAIMMSNTQDLARDKELSDSDMKRGFLFQEVAE